MTYSSLRGRWIRTQENLAFPWPVLSWPSIKSDFLAKGLPWVISVKREKQTFSWEHFFVWHI
jgi:hypothetical protein